ncbi:MAG: hypothetical protein II085_00350 [Alphaproteobacteria bacterium]|nr:hypothetical protein [Alphaproteobacteria bacterium]
MTVHGLVNCKKCGTLFFKTSGREICDECFKKELDTIDNIKAVIQKSEADKIPLEDLPSMTGLDLDELKDLIERGRLFTVLPRIAIKCRFCGIDLADDEKTGFTCKKCLMKFSPKVNELQKKGIDVHKYEQEAKNLNRRLRGGYRTNNTSDNSRRFGFIQNYDL